MKSLAHQRYESDLTPSRIVVERYRADPDEHPGSLALLHYRGGEEELQLGLEYSRSQNVEDRIVGTVILAELGWPDPTFLTESVTRLIEMLDDPEPRVLVAAAAAFSHRGDPASIPHLLRFASHPDAEVRLGVVFGLAYHDVSEVIRAYISFTKDEDADVRNYAVFALGSQMEVDTPEIREALIQALKDEDWEVRGEALVGLAKRGYPLARQLLFDELTTHEEVSYLSAEAALIIDEHLPDLTRALPEERRQEKARLIAALKDSLAGQGTRDPA